MFLEQRQSSFSQSPKWLTLSHDTSAMLRMLMLKKGQNLVIFHKT